jgi:light-regulated signal transduction histidine kinase (bacteriophytochrome)
MSIPDLPPTTDASAASLQQALHECETQLAQERQEMAGLLYAVSHDLRAPLRAVSGFSQALREHAGSSLDSTALHYLQRIEDSSRRMTTLLDGLLSLSRLSQAEMLWTDIDLSKLSDEVALQLAQQHPEHQPELLIAPNMQIHGDARLLRQVLQRLLENAWKCTAGKPGARIEVGGTLLNSQPVYYVRDNGVGFDMNYINKLFVPFQQVHARTELNGIGLGLAGAQRIIARHGGRIWAEASPDHGAQFFFTVPSSAAAMAS